MTIWQSCECETFFADDRVSASELCIVRIDGPQIVVEGALATDWMFEGTEVASGHYVLKSITHEGNGTLHRSGLEDILEGSWRQQGVYGMWRIRLQKGDEEMRTRIDDIETNR